MEDALSQLRIMVCTDTHIGYKEQDPIRGQDSLISFEEILRTAKEQKVDFVLHGGDLFDENKPTRKTLFNVMRKLREYCMGDEEVLFDCVNDSPPIAGGKVNFHDASYNICLPVFCIHGNHDDPGESNLAAADLLAGANLINYIGRQANCDTVTVKPVLLVKGNVKLALYGLGNIRDDRINRAFQSGQVQFERPSDEDWFNLLVLHQNRYKGNTGGAPIKSCVNEEMLPAWIDLVIWGHEHDCRIQPEETFHGEFFISQPGSSVATSLSQGEAIEKHVGILEIRHGKTFRLCKHKLQTVRPFYIDQLVLSDTDVDPTNDAAIWSFLTARVEEMLRQHKGDTLPLMRLKVEHTKYPIVASGRFGLQFAGRVANPDSVLLFHKQRTVSKSSKDEVLTGVTRATKRDDTVFSFLEVDQMGVLPMNDFNAAVDNYSSKEDIRAIERFVEHTASKSLSESSKIKTVIGRAELMKTLKDKAETIRVLRDVAVKEDEENAPAPRLDVDRGDSDVESMEPPRKRAKAAGKPRAKKMSKKDAAVVEPIRDVGQAMVAASSSAFPIGGPHTQPHGTSLSPPWLTPTPAKRIVNASPAVASTPFSAQRDSSADLMSPPASASPAVQVSRRMPWGLKKK